MCVLGTNSHFLAVFQLMSLYLRKKKEKKTRLDTQPIPVVDGWAGAKMRVSPLSQLDDLNRETNQWTNRRTKPLIEVHFATKIEHNFADQLHLPY